jgi:hypothetical protein
MTTTEDGARTAATVDDRLRKHFVTEFADERLVQDLSQRFRRYGYVKIRDLVPDDIKSAVSQDVYRLLERAKRVDLRMKETSDSPRRMSTVGRQHIAAGSSLIADIYQSQGMMDFLTRLAREPVVACPYEPEQYVLTRQERAGDTHGWHWGDFSFTLIWIIEAPPIEFGGLLQCVPHTNWDKSNPSVHEYLVKYPIDTYYNATGDIYFLRTDTTLHRTVPLTQETTRIILNTCWASVPDAQRARSHETMDALFE